jgi:ZIP family zinc transporter/zinc and cadmium transporter
MYYLWISLALGLVAGLANMLGGGIVTARPWRRNLLAYFIAFGSGFMLATTITVMIPESFERMAGARAALWILVGYFVVHVFEHSLPAHFHFGEETHAEEFLHAGVAYAALGGLLTHTFFDGVCIACGFLISNWLGIVIFGAVILHNVPEGFTMASVMAAAKKSRAAGMWAVAALGISRLVGILAMAVAQRWVNYGLALSAGVTMYVAASDLIPEVNKLPGPRVALTVGAGVALVLLLRFCFLGSVVP